MRIDLHRWYTESRRNQAEYDALVTEESLALIRANSIDDRSSTLLMRFYCDQNHNTGTSVRLALRGSEGIDVRLFRSTGSLKPMSLAGFPDGGSVRIGCGSCDFKRQRTYAQLLRLCLDALSKDGRSKTHIRLP